MKIRDLMTTTELATARPEDTLELAAQIMLWRGVTHLPVVRGEVVVGMVSEHELVGHRLGQAASTVGSVMRKGVPTAGPDDDVADAAITMASERVGCVPVIGDGKLVGVITPSDILASRVAQAPRPHAGDSPPVRTLMTRDVATTRSDDALADAAGRMQALGIRHLPVIDGDRRLLGILSDRDVRAAAGSPAAATSEAAERARVGRLRVGDVMTRDPFCVGPSATLDEVGRWIIDRRVGAVPVVDGDHKILGIVSYVDVVRVLLERSEQARS